MAHRILVVDDAPDLTLVMRMLLERAGHEVVTAENGRHGLRRFFETRPDLVMLDIRMPDLDGWETLERLRDLSDVPVLIVSALTLASDDLDRLRPGIDGFHPKPVRGPELVSLIHDLLCARAAQPQATRTMRRVGRPLSSVTARQGDGGRPSSSQV